MRFEIFAYSQLTKYWDIIILLGDINQIIMKPLPYLTLILLFHCLSASTTIPGSHTGTPAIFVHSHSYPFTSTGGETICKLLFSFNPSLPIYSAVMYASTSNTNSLSSDYTSYFHQNPLNFFAIDLENANKGQTQTVQITGLAPNTPITIYIQVMVDSTMGFSYNIVATQTMTLANTCNIPSLKAAFPSPFCTSCGGSYYQGAYCNFLDRTLTNNTQISQQIHTGKYVAFTIPGTSSQITLNYGSDQPSVEVFIQFKTFSGEIAGLFNVVPTGGGSYAAYTIVNPAQSYQLTINSGSTDVSIGVLNQNSNTVNFTIWYTVTSTVNILVIVLGVLGGLLLIALIVVACFIIKRMRNPQQVIHPNSSAALVHQAQIQSNMLSGEEIETYFPSVSCRTAFSELQSSSLNLNQQNQQNIDKDCVICLCPVDGNELMKVTYCRHIFHSHCLIEWFKKQRNCPYCREEYSKPSTIEHYQLLLKESKRNMLAGVQLVQQLIRSKTMKSSILIEDVKD